MKKTVLVVSLLTTGCSGLSKLDYGNLYHRAGWQLPNKVIIALDIEPGDRVADIGAGGGYFTFRLAEVVGQEGLVYAVDVDQEVTEDLREKASRDNYENVVVILGEFDNPLLPDGTIDLVFLCNTYHHIDKRVDYFAKLKVDLTSQGRLAVVDMKDDLSGLLRLFTTSEHWTPRQLMLDEMAKAGYHHAGSFEFLPLQNLEIFSPN